MAKAEAKKPLWHVIHDAACPGSIFHVKALQQICPVCRADLEKAKKGSAR